MQRTVTVVAFVFIVLGLGRAVLAGSRATHEANPIVRLLETAGIGFATFSFASVVLGLLHIPLHWIVYCGLAAVGFAWSIFVRLRGRKVQSQWKWEESIPGALLLLVLIAFFVVYLRGANAYAWLEDDDPWHHAEGALYVAKAYTCDVSPTARIANESFAKYLEPYPPTYDVLMGVLRQLNDSIYWTLKTFNVVIVTGAIAFNYLLAKTYFGSARKALFVAFVLAVLPSFMSHFIFSQSLALCIFPIALSSAIKAMRDQTWTIPAVVSIASMMITQPVVSFCFGVVLVLFIAFAALMGRARSEAALSAKRGFVVAAAGAALSLLYWGRQLIKWGADGILAAKGDEMGKWQSPAALLRVTFDEVLDPPLLARIDAPVGWGAVLTLAIIVGIAGLVAEMALLRGRTSVEHPHLLAWFFPLAYLALAPGLDLPAWGSSRMWAYVAVPVAFLGTEGFFLFTGLFATRSKWEAAAQALCAIAVAWTCLPAKLAVETTIWPPGVQWMPARRDQLPADLAGFMQMRTALPKGARVYSFCGIGRSIGFDMDESPWVEGEAEFRRQAPHMNAADAIEFLGQQRYEYLVIDGACARDWGADTLSAFIRNLLESPRLHPVLSKEGFLVAQLTPPRAEPAVSGRTDELDPQTKSKSSRENKGGPSWPSSN